MPNTNVNNLTNKIDDLNNSIDNLVKTLEKTSYNMRQSTSGGGRKITFQSGGLSDYVRLGRNPAALGQRLGEYSGYYSHKLGVVGRARSIAGKTGAATKAIGLFSKGLGAASKFLGPFGQAIQIGIEALELFAGVLGKINTYVSQYMKLQTNLNEMSYQRGVDIKNLFNQRLVETIKINGDVNLKQAEIQGQNLLQAVDILTKQFVKATEIAVGPLTKGINETAYDAASAYLDYRAEQAKFGLERGLREQQFENFASRRNIEYQMYRNLSSRQEERIEGEFKYNSFMQALDTEFEQRANLPGRGWTWLRDMAGDLGPTKWGLPMFGWLPAVSALSVPTEGEKQIEKQSQDRMYLPTGEYSVNKNDAFLNNLEILRQIGDARYNNWDALLDYLGAGKKDKLKIGAQNLLQPELFGVKYGESEAQWLSDRINTIVNFQEQAANKQIEIATEVGKKYIEASVEAQKIWLQLSQNAEKWLDEFDQVTNNLGVSMGYTNRKQMDNFQHSMFEANKVASQFGKSFKEVAQMQEDFAETTGRNRMFGQHDYGQLLGLGKYLGDDGLAANYASEMEIFNTGVADSVDMLDEALQDVNRMGLNGRKYTKTLVDNLKLAQKYNFKDGTKGLMNMAKWAENTRFNMNSLSSMLDKVSEGGLEGVITQGAQFQVLGGHSAMNADPLAMIYERYANPAAYARRMQDMTIGYGQLDRKTGETTFTGTEQMLMEQIAKTQGRSLEEVMNEVRARNKREVVAKQLGYGFNEEQQAFISNNATYDKATGRFKVKVKSGNGYKDMDVNELTEQDLENLMPEEHNERMEDYMIKVLDYLAYMTGEENLEKGQLGEAIWGDRISSYAQRLLTAHENFANEFDTYVANARDGMQLANEKFRDYIQMWQNNSDAQGPGLDQINAATSNIAAALDGTASVIATANERIAASLNNARLSADGITGTDERDYWSSWHNATNKTNKITVPYRLNESPYKFGFEDGIISNGNTPIISQAKNITKINDGLVKSNPKDVAIFAKEGGVIGNFISDLYDDVHSSIGGGNGNIRLEISGNLNLSSNGESINIINDIKNDPVALRALSRMLFAQTSNAENGGRGMTDISMGSR